MEWDTNNISEYVVKFKPPDILAGETKYYISPPVGNPLYDISYSEKYLSTQPRYSAETNSYSGDVAYNPPTNQKKLKEYEFNDTVEDKIIELKIRYEASSNTKYRSTIEKEIEALEKSLDKLTYYNVFEGDAYRYRPRGYLYMIGRRQYWDFYQNEIPSSKNILAYPEKSNLTKVQAFKTAFLVWTKLKDKTENTPYDYTNSKKISIEQAGTASTFQRTINSSRQLPDGDTTSKSFEVFEKVLNIFKGSDDQPLMDTNRP